MHAVEWLWLLGRVALGGLYVLGGIRHCLGFTPVAQQIAARGIPAPRLVLAAGTAIQSVAGVFLIVGARLTLAALVLAVFTLLASMMMLDFWNMEGRDRDNAIRTWESNIALVGGLLIAAAYAASR